MDLINLQTVRAGLADRSAFCNRFDGKTTQINATQHSPQVVIVGAGWVSLRSAYHLTQQA